MADKIGLVLSGGGAKGAYEIGVFKALSQFCADRMIDSIIGTSVGALNAVLLEDKGADYAEKVWLDLKTTDLLHFEKEKMNFALEKLNSLLAPTEYLETEEFALSNNILNTSALKDLIVKGPVSQKKIEELIDNNVNFSRLKRQIYVVCSQIGKKTTCFRINDYPDETKKQILLASAAIPGVYRGIVGVKIGDEYYYDGGVTSEGNTPLAYLYERGFRSMIVVHLREKPDLTSQILYPDAKIVNIIPSKPMGNFITGTLYLTKNKVEENINLGYNDTMKKMNDIIKMINS